MIKFMVHSLALMVTLRDGVSIPPVVSTVGDTIAMGEVVLTFYEAFLLLKFEDSTGEDDLPLKILRPPLKKY